MKLLDEIRLAERVERPNGEELYRIAGFREQLEALNEGILIVEDCILTPYYIHDGALYELYEYEMNIRLTDQPDFRRYLLKKTGKGTVEEVPDQIVRLQRECYIEVLTADGLLSVGRLLQYIDFLFAEETVISQVQQVFGVYQPDGLRFSVY
nr:hypothetical protein [uncultured Oscillibacter sp.]